ncbi:DegT/DnrJ/EryC1/StrS family aminotransferase [Azospirillum sp.]|uniref:DegT/DnrJ/EryC1/StrS family aminotransferase n=1 Tax=Azospirillum sp. TaxID=34012 RepID=UPI002D469F0B|nr:aminotransferase class I/II-fold pyridoxal phosphate-dependent enzyme [Azospirillum sp.]HYD64537.1 aminotransferase class I/II-fold pyridoxal phosphate-dependent enzyme [Azospirillum sp.]
MSADPEGAPRLFLSPPHMAGTELGLIEQAFASNYVAPAGPMLEAFERAFRELTGIPHALAVTSGTAALHLALRELGVGPGDAVWSATLTFIGGVAPITYLGAEPVFLDVAPATWTLDPNRLEAALKIADAGRRLPKAVITTDLYGQSADLDAIRALCAPFGIPVVADAAEALGATYRGRAAGHGAAAAVWSFNGNKIITTSGGGMLASHDAALIERARFLSQQARDPAPHYQHSTVGYNYRMSNIVAAIGVGQLGMLEERVRRRRAIFERYREALGDLPGLSFMPEAPYGRANRWLTVVQIDPGAFGADREAVRLALEVRNIESRPVWKPMHRQPVFAESRRFGGEVADRLFEHGLCLPSGSAMTDADQARVVAVIRRLAGQSKP